MSHGTESTTHPATRLDDDDPVPGQDSPAHDTAWRERFSATATVGRARRRILGNSVLSSEAEPNSYLPAPLRQIQTPRE